MTADDLWPGGPRPFGLDIVYADDPSSKTRDARLVINAAEAKSSAKAPRTSCAGSRSAP